MYKHRNRIYVRVAEGLLHTPSSVLPAVGTMLAKAPARCVPPLGARALSKMPAVQVHPEVTELEKYKIVKRRIMKAEREERMDLTKALTPVKTYTNVVSACCTSVS